MKAIILEKPGQFHWTDIERPPDPGLEEALVRVHRVGVCGTDLHAFEGKQTFFEYPRILGHELCVEIVALGDAGANLRVGDQCAVEPYLNCARCIACRRGKPNCCVNLRVLGVHVDGGMREQMLVPIDKLHRSAKLSFNQLALVEPLSVAAHAVRRANVEAGEVVLIVGAGPIGLGVIEFARAAGARVIVLEISESRLRFCRQTMKIDCCLNAAGKPLAEIQTSLAGDLPTAVFDCTGSPPSMMAAFNFVAHGGRLIFVGHFPGDVTFHDPLFHGREMTLLGTRNATRNDFQQVIQQMEQGQIDIASWIADPVPHSAITEIFSSWLQPERELIKPLIEWRV
ncbi:MAG TPA: zinc-binding alcohol dehydrogenase family protein [Acidobacteriota bacterium]|nr:zinc-binding alcohol dehydrogenase family protein [Acidobacteriota bacterium]